MTGVLDAEVQAALRANDLRWSGWECLSSLMSPALDRVTYRIDLTDGGPAATVKARRMPSEEAARVQAEIRSALPDAFTAVLVRHGRVLLEEWVDGEVVGAAPDAMTVRRAAGVLAELHMRPTLDGRTLFGRESTAEQRRATVQAVHAVRRAGLLRREDAAVLARALRREDPGTCLYGLIHTDFCGVNMVADRQGRLRVVDNERLGRDALGYDLGRAWYRWALAPDAWSGFLDAYRTALAAPGAPEPFRFWQIVAAVRALEIRLRYTPDNVEAPLVCLRRLMAEMAT
ncbi:aminoglycoside phosphotransferase family protein [bacterium]|nr:aminoglycoside phosphotransferase family protein [bacterium]